MTLKTQIKKVFAKVEKIPEKQSGFLGRADGTVRVPGKRHWLYVRLWNGNVVEAYNQNVPANFGLAVDVVYRNGQYFVQARQVYQDVVNTSVPDGLEDELQWPGTHTLYTRPEQILPGLVYPKSGLTVYVFGLNIPLPDGGYIEVPSNELDLTPYIPETGAIWAVISLDEDGEIGVTTGGDATSWGALDKSEIPDVENGYALFAIKLFNGQTSLQHGVFGSVFVDLRWVRKGGGGGPTDLPANRVIATDGSGTPVTDSPFWDTDGQIRWSDVSFTFPASTLLGWRIAGQGKTPGFELIRASDSNLAGAINITKYGGTLGSPTAVLDSWRLGSFSFGGHYGTGIDSLKARISAEATQDWDADNRGTVVKVAATPNDSDTIQDVAEFGGDEINLLVPTYVPSPAEESDDEQAATTEWVRDFAQPLDSDLTAIAGLTPANDDIIQRKSGVWINRTMAQVAADLTLLLPADGWIAAPGTWSYSSADSPTFVASVNADVTAILQPGYRIKLTQTTAKYFIVTAVGSFSGGATLVTLYGGTDSTLANAAISSPFYSPVKAPFGFPMSPDKWTITTTDTTTRTLSTPTVNVWYNAMDSGNLPSIAVPIGLWRVSYKLQGRAQASSGFAQLRSSLSTSSSSVSDADFTEITNIQDGGNTIAFVSNLPIKSYPKTLTIASKTTYYLIISTVAAIANMQIQGAIAPTTIKAECAYL